MFINQLRFIIKSDIAIAMMSEMLSCDEPVTSNEVIKARQVINQHIEEFHNDLYGGMASPIISQYLELLDVGYEAVSRVIKLPFGIDSMRIMDELGHVLLIVSVSTYRL